MLALAGSAAAYSLKVLGLDPVTRDRASASSPASLAGVRQRAADGRLRACRRSSRRSACSTSPAALAAWIVAGQQLTGWNEGYNLIGRKIGDILDYFGIAAPERLARRSSPTSSACRRSGWCSSSIIAGIVLAFMPLRPEALRHRRQPPRRRLCRHQHQPRPLHRAGVLRASARRMAGLINVAYFRSFNPVAGQFRELDGIAAVIIGGGSIFGGYGTIIGALAGAAVITLVRALLQLNCRRASPCPSTGSTSSSAAS